MRASEPSFPASIGRYLVVRVLGQGAMGRVLLAHDPVLDRDVAVKQLRDDLGVPPEHRESLLVRMRQEARASARVSHPHIVTLHDMGESAEEGLYLVFELVEGPTLKERLESGPLPPAEVARLARELGSALATAHEAGVLHRDVKPDNVILSRNGAKIADFGIARLPDSTLTRDGGLLGTPAYSAPESLAGSRFSPQSDQFSLAATLWEALSGRRAFPGDDALSVSHRIANEEPPRIAEVCGVDGQVDRVFARALSKNEAARYPSCEDFGRALSEALELPRRGGVVAPREDGGRQSIPSALPAARSGGGFVAGALLGGGVVFAALTWLVPQQLPVQLPEVPERAHAAPAVSAPGEKVPLLKVAKKVARPRGASEPDNGAEGSDAGSPAREDAGSTASPSATPVRSLEPAMLP